MTRKLFPHELKHKPTEEESFWSHVDKSGNCWLWTAGRDTHEYGRCAWVQGHSKQGRAHRFAWQATYGAIPDGMCVLHKCDTPPCVNPSHLFLGTQADNMADMVAKGRNAKGDRNGHRLHPGTAASGDRNGSRTHPERLARGSANWQAKLIESQASEIRKLHEEGGSPTEIGARFGVSAATVCDIAARRTWKHVP